MNQDKLIAAIRRLKIRQNENPDAVNEAIAERCGRIVYYQSFSEEKLLVMSEDEFYKLLNGEIYPGLICKPHRDYFTYMLDDFIDLYVDEKEKESYVEWYGQTFVDSQKLIKERLKVY